VKVGVVFGAALGAYCWQSVAFQDTYREWRQQNYNKDVEKVFVEFLKQQESLKKYICPIKNILCICPIKIERVTNENKTEIFYYSGTDLADPNYVKQVIKHTQKKELTNEDIRIDFVAFIAIFTNVNELLNKQKITIKNTFNEIDDKIFLNGLKHIRQTIVNYGKSVSEHEIKEMTKIAKEEDITEEEIQRRKNRLKFAYLQLDTLEKTDTLELFRSVVEGTIAALEADEKITHEEHKKRVMEIASASFDFKNKKIA
jgi:hypothetical protein